MTGQAETGDIEPLWRTHHHPDQYDRCVRVAGRRVCRRCVVLYPLAFGVLALSLAAWPAGQHPWLLAVLPIPAVVEWWLEHLERIDPSPGRTIATTVLLAVALGRGLARYLEDPLDPWFWAMVVVYGGACLAVVGWRFLDERAL